MAWTIFTYPVQRQRLPAMPSLISCSLGLGFLSSRALAESNMPGAQKPHCTAAVWMKACCRGWRCVGSPRPSMVRMSLPSALIARYRQALTGSPSSSTVQAPHSPVLQPSLVPVKPILSRMASSSRSLASTDTRCSSPLTLRLMFFFICRSRCLPNCILQGAAHQHRAYSAAKIGRTAHVADGGYFRRRHVGGFRQYFRRDSLPREHLLRFVRPEGDRGNRTQRNARGGNLVVPHCNTRSGAYYRKRHSSTAAKTEKGSFKVVLKGHDNLGHNLARHQ